MGLVCWVVWVFFQMYCLSFVSFFALICIRWKQRGYEELRNCSFVLCARSKSHDAIKLWIFAKCLDLVAFCLYMGNFCRGFLIAYFSMQDFAFSLKQPQVTWLYVVIAHLWFGILPYSPSGEADMNCEQRWKMSCPLK